MSFRWPNASFLPDILIIGTGMGGATLAAGLAGSGATIVILERGEQLPDEPATRDTRTIFMEGHYRPRETWLDGEGPRLQPRQLLLCRRQFEVLRRGHAALPRARTLPRSSSRGRHPPAGRSPTPSWSPGTPEAEQLCRCAARGRGLRRSRRAPRPIPTRPCRTRRPSPARASGLKAVGLQPFSLPLAVDIERWLARARTPWDAYPDTRTGKLDAETASLARALADPNVRLVTGTRVIRLLTAPDGGRIEGVEVGGRRRRAVGAEGRDRRARGRRGELRRAAARLGQRGLPRRARQPLRHGRAATS